MTTYNTYQEAKIAMPKACICVYKNNGKDVFIGMPSREGTTLFNGSEFAEPQDYCMTVEKFLVDGHEVFMGDAIINTNGNVNYITQGDAKMINSEGGATFNNARYILRAAALENIPTETPEEKEALDGIESAGEVEWKNGDLLEFNGEPCVFIGDYNGIPVVRYTENADQSLAGCLDEIYAVDKLKKPETPQQRKDRERLEVIDEMCWDVHSLKFSQASALYEAGYRKEKTHGTN